LAEVEKHTKQVLFALFLRLLRQRDLPDM